MDKISLAIPKPDYFTKFAQKKTTSSLPLPYHQQLYQFKMAFGDRGGRGGGRGAPRGGGRGGAGGRGGFGGGRGGGAARGGGGGRG